MHPISLRCSSGVGDAITIEVAHTNVASNTKRAFGVVMMCCIDNSIFNEMLEKLPSFILTYTVPKNGIYIS